MSASVVSKTFFKAIAIMAAVVVDNSPIAKPLPALTVNVSNQSSLRSSIHHPITVSIGCVFGMIIRSC